MPDERVRCANCGLLSFRNMKTREFYEVDRSYRRVGAFTEGAGYFSQYPVCLAMKFDLEAECRKVREAADKLPPGTILQREFAGPVIELDRFCDGFAIWKQGFSPKEHAEQKQQEVMLKLQQEWQANQAKLADDRHRDNLAYARWNMIVAASAAALTSLAAVVAAIVGAWLAYRLAA